MNATIYMVLAAVNFLFGCIPSEDNNVTAYSVLCFSMAALMCYYAGSENAK